jgi:hypothetical protein
LKLEITKEWLEKRAALEGDSEIGAGLPTYVPPFIPSEADRYYGAIIAKMQAALASHTSSLAEKDARIAELEAALKRAAASAGFQYMTSETREAIDAAISGGRDA